MIGNLTKAREWVLRIPRRETSQAALKGAVRAKAPLSACLLCSRKRQHEKRDRDRTVERKVRELTRCQIIQHFAVHERALALPVTQGLFKGHDSSCLRPVLRMV